MDVITNREIYYNLNDKKEKKDRKNVFQNTGDKIKKLKENQLFQTGAAAYGGYLQQKYQGGGFQPLETTTTTNELPKAEVTDKEPEGMSRNLKIGLGIGVAAVIGIVIFVVVKNKRSKK